MSEHRRGNLQAEVSSFVGRSGDVARIRELFARTRLITVSGPGGIGKTRVALQVATRLGRAFPGGTWFVDLTSVGEGTEVDSTVADVIGIQEQSGQPVGIAIAEGLRGQSTLLVLDNCEHVLDSCATLCRTLLERCSDLSIMTTSREPLGIAGEMTLRLKALELPSEVAGVRARDAMRFESVQLFFIRASAADPNFVITDENAQVICEICQRLDGIPLGIELAAVRVRTLGLDDLAERLQEDQLSLWHLSSRAGPPRHRTLSKMLDWSYSLLNDQERILWRRLSVFVGGFTVAAAERVCSDEALPRVEVVDTFTRLLEKSIISIRKEGRYYLLEPIRLYGRDRLAETNEVPRLESERLRWCGEIAESSGAWWYGKDQLAWLRTMTDEEGNIRSALDDCLRSEALAEEGLDLLYKTWLPWFIGGSYSWTRAYAQGLLARRGISRHGRARGLLTAGFVARKQGDLENAERLLAECRDLTSRRHDLVRERAFASVGLATVRIGRGEAIPRGLRSLRHALALLEESDAPVMYVSFLAVLAHYSWRGLPDPARADLEEIRALVEYSLDGRSSDTWARGLVQSQLGVIKWLLGESEAAEQDLKQAIRLQSEIRHGWGIAANLESLAWIAASTERGERSAQLLEAAYSLWERLNAPFERMGGRYRDACEVVIDQQLSATRRAEIRAEVRAYTFEELVGLGLGEGSITQGSVTVGTETPRLTTRELEVARLVAHGATNRELAAALVVSDNTAKTHVRHIMQKLGFKSRVQIAGWVAEQSRAEQ